MMALSRLMPNLSGPKASKRRILGAVVHSIMLYAAPIWGEIMDKKKYRNILSGVQRRLAIRVGSAYRTISAEAIQVITGIKPLEPMVAERGKTFSEGEAQRKEAKKQTANKWQEEWEKDNGKAKWTKKLIKNVEKWNNRKHGEVDYYITQLLGGHGCYGAYLNRFHIRDTAECWYCGDTDTPEHTFFKCKQWTMERERAQRITQATLTVDNIVDVMLSNEEHWNAIRDFTTSVLKKKEAAVNKK